MRWHARLCHEGRLSMREAHLVLSALHALPAHGESAARTLRAICDEHELGEAAVVLEA